MNHGQKVTLGCALIVAGAWVLHEAYEATGRRRPFAIKFLPGA